MDPSPRPPVDLHPADHRPADHPATGHESTGHDGTGLDGRGHDRGGADRADRRGARPAPPLADLTAELDVLLGRPDGGDRLRPVANPRRTRAAAPVPAPGADDRVHGGVDLAPPRVVEAPRGERTAVADPVEPVWVEPTSGRAAVLAATALPSPPSDEEKQWYMGRQHRWLLFTQAAALGFVVFSIARFALSEPLLLVFLAPATLYVVTAVVSLLSSTRGKRTSREDHERRVRSYAPSVHPSVDVFLPTAGEPLDVLENTYRHVARLDWPGRVVAWVLDDAASPEVEALAARHGFEYRVRPNRGHLKKAGNLKSGYDQSDGDLIAIFDADFVPRRDYLRELVPYFVDRSTGIVQSPQYFDAVKGMKWLQRCAGATQELFYRWIQPSRDRSRAAICVGTCAIYRRSALEEAGGFAQIGHSEDVHTGVKLMKAGYQLRYVPIVVSKGLCPDTMLGFLNQQYRWCTGSMSLLADRSFHRNPIFSARQRLSFWSGFLYYISTGVNIFIAPLPGLVMLYAFPDFIHPRNTAWLLGAVMLWYFVLPTMMRSHWRMDVLRVQQLYSFAHAVAIVHVITGRTKEWVATGSANTRTTPLAVTITRVMRTTVVLTQTSVWTGMAWATARYGIDHTWAMLGFALLSGYIQIPMLFLRTRAKEAGRQGGGGSVLSVLPRRLLGLAHRSPTGDHVA